MSAPAESVSPSSLHESGIKCQTHRRFSMNCAEYEALWERADGRCEGCGRNAEDGPGERLVIDHDHKYGPSAVRGLLCIQCNRYLGLAETKADRPVLAQDIRGVLFVPYLETAWFMRDRRTPYKEKTQRAQAPARQELTRAELERLRRFKAAWRPAHLTVPGDSLKRLADNLWVNFEEDELTDLIKLLTEYLDETD